MKDFKFDLIFVYKTLFFVIGIFVLTLGVSITYEAQALGVGAFETLNIGLSNAYGHSVAFWVTVVGITILAVDAIIRRGMPQFASIIPMVLVGLTLDFWMEVMENVQPASGFPELLTLILGLLLIGLGIALCIQPKFSPVPLEAILVTVSETFKISIRLIKTIIEGVLLIFAFIVGGPIGIGTIIITFSVGPAIQFFYGPVGKIYKKVVK